MSKGQVTSDDDKRVKYRWGKTKQERFKMLYLKGVVLKRIAEELDVSIQACKNQRRAMALPPRRKKGTTWFKELSVRVPTEELYRKVRARASAQGKTINSYIIYLAQRDSDG